MKENKLSAVSAIQKFKYPKCDRKKQHAKESLNFICYSPSCKSKGLICVLCKSTAQHSGHLVLPLRSFLCKVDECLKKMQLGKQPSMQQKQPCRLSFDKMMQRLQQTHLQILGTLQIQISQISQRIRSCEQQIIKQYNSAHKKLHNQVDKPTIIHTLLETINQIFIQERQANLDLKHHVLKLLTLLKIDKINISIQCEAENAVNLYNLAGTTFKMNMLIWQKQTNNILGDVFKLKPEYQLKDMKNRPTTAIDPITKAISAYFSPQLKTDSVVLQKDNKIAKLKDDKHGKIILINQRLLDIKYTTVKFKIVALSAASSMQIGIGLKGIITPKLFKFDKTNLTHGTYMISSNSFIYTHNQQLTNNIKGGFAFKVGDQISIEVDSKQSKAIFKKKADSKMHQISLKLVGENDWNDLHFCVCLNGIGDKIQVLA